jgi:anti-anti-sigma regulatory factor
MAASTPTTVVLDVSTLAPSVSTIDALARFQLAARRRGQRLRLRQASDELRQLIAFAGLSEVLRVEPRRQSEEREQRLRVEEERELDDPTA